MIKMTIKTTWKLVNVYGNSLPKAVTALGVTIDNEDNENLLVPAGTYKMERILSPKNHSCFWLVIKDTLVGAAENFLRFHQNGILKDINLNVIDRGKYEIILEYS